MSRPAISQELRARIAETCADRCGYCRTSGRVIGPLLEIDHIVPIAQGGSSDEENLTLACPLCNSHKADKVSARDPETGDPVPLFHPRKERWRDHFEWSEDGTSVRGKTSVGRATVEALQMNRAEMVIVRRLWTQVGWHPPSD